MLGITNVSNAPSIVLTNTSVSTWTALPSTGTDSDMKTQGYTYYASIPCNGISANTIAEVTFSEANAKSGNYASTCRTYANEIRVYSKVNTAITIPSIIIHSIVESYYAVDNSPPTSGKTTAITSGAVYSSIGFARYTTDNSTTCTNNDTDYDVSGMTATTDKSNGLFTVSSGATITANEDCIIEIVFAFTTQNSSSLTRAGPSLYINNTRIQTLTPATEANTSWVSSSITFIEFLNKNDTAKIRVRSVPGGGIVKPVYMSIFAISR